MKKLNTIINCPYDTKIYGIKTNSKEVQPGDLFICIKGVITDRHDYIPEAIKNGAVALITAQKVDVNIPYVIVDNPNEELYNICENFYDFPDEKLKIIGVTGTDGKTSTTTIIQALIGNNKCGIIGTNGRKCSKFDKPTNNTTPDIDKLLEYFNEFVNASCEYIAMEASSEAFYNQRLKHITFDTSGYTNVTSEHLNIHKTLENYIDCKRTLFKQTKNYCILNHDDSHFEDMKKTATNYLTYGKSKNNDLIINDYKLSAKGTIITYEYKNKKYNIISPLLGEFNVYNLACAILILLAMGFDMENLIKNIKNIKVDGRLEFIDMGQKFKVMVDYAHTPNGIANLLNFINTLNFNKIIVVIGQAGERDKSKRPKVGEVVVKNSNHAIFTYEDPRHEDPVEIINDIISTVKENYNNYEIIVDRKEAIKKAIFEAKENDCVLILGKGSETYEKIGDNKIYFNDIEEVKKSLQNLLEYEKN